MKNLVEIEYHATRVAHQVDALLAAVRVRDGELAEHHGYRLLAYLDDLRAALEAPQPEEVAACLAAIEGQEAK